MICKERQNYKADKQRLLIPSKMSGKRDVDYHRRRQYAENIIRTVQGHRKQSLK